MISLNRNVLLIVAVMGLAACGRGGDTEKIVASSPEGAVMALAQALQANDLELFLRSSLHEDDYAEARREWDLARAGAIDAADREQVDAVLAALADDDLVEGLMQEIGPSLEAARPNLPLMLMVAQTMGHANISANEALTEAQKNAANELLAALGKWAGGKDLANPELARAGLTQWVAAARKIDLKSSSDLQALEFEEMLARVGILMAATRDMLNVYGFALDDVFASVKASVLRQQGDTALVRVNFVLLDIEQQFDVVLLRQNGRWLPASLMAEKLRDQKIGEQLPAEI